MSITTTPQQAKVYALFDNPPTVFACRVNGTFSTLDRVVVFGYDTVTTGAYTSVKPGMTVLVGSSAGTWDKGITCVRKNLTASLFFCNETSDVSFADNLYVTVIQDFSIWAKYPIMLSDGNHVMNYDVVYTNQHAILNPCPVLGPDRIQWLPAGGTVTVTFDGSNSYVPQSTITGHLFTCSGGSLTGGTTATPSIVFNATGRYLLTYTVTSALGATTTTYRLIHIINLSMVYEVAMGSVSTVFGGGCDFSMTTLNTPFTMRERCKVYLVAREWYGDTEISYGPVVGAENIVALGWLENEGVVIDRLKGTVTFTARGTSYWLQQTSNFVTAGMLSVSGTPTKWLEMTDITVDKALWHLFMWRSTIFNCTDVILTGDTKVALGFQVPEGSLWDQINTVAARTLLATPTSDRYGRMYVMIEPSLLPVASRASIPVTASLTKADFTSIDIERQTVNKVAQVILSGMNIFEMVGYAKVALAPGHIPSHHGSLISVEGLLLGTQAEANELAGNYFARENQEYHFNIKGLLYNNRLIGTAPIQFVNLTLLSADNMRGISYNAHIVVKRTDYSLANGVWTIDLEADPETFPALNVTGDVLPPFTGVPTDTNPEVSTIPPTPFPAFPPFPVVVPSPPPPVYVYGSCPDSSPATGPFLSAWDRSYIDGNEGTNISRSWNRCTIRSGTATNKTFLLFYIKNAGLAYQHLSCYGIDSAGNRLIAGMVTNVDEYQPGYQLLMRVDFSPVSATSVAGFELECDLGYDLYMAGGSNAFTVSGGFAGGGNYVKTTFYGGDITPPTTEILDDSTAFGFIKYRLTAHGATHWVGSAWEQEIVLHPAPGSMGSFYLVMNYLATSSGAFRLRRDFSGQYARISPTDGNGNFVKTYELYKQSTPAIAPGGPGFPGSYFDFDFKTYSNTYDPAIEFTTSIYYSLYYSASIPERSAGLQNVNIYNVCPTELS